VTAQGDVMVFGGVRRDRVDELDLHKGYRNKVNTLGMANAWSLASMWFCGKS
jgi:hypothetical protein